MRFAFVIVRVVLGRKRAEDGQEGGLSLEAGLIRQGCSLLMLDHSMVDVRDDRDDFGQFLHVRDA